MKKILLSLILIIAILPISVYCQSPQAFKYQAIVRDNSGNIIQNQTVGVRVSIHEETISGTIIYQESFSEITNQFGLLNLEIGTGTPTIGTFSAINWGSSPKFLETAIDASGGTSYVSMGTSELLSVPYALYSGATGDTSRWRNNGNSIYYNTGNVGIGTTNPQGELHVNNPAVWDGVTFTGTGLNDLNVNYSNYSGSGSKTYVAEVTNAGPTPNMFRWSSDYGQTWVSNVPMALSGINVNYGITIGFGAISGHTFGDQWTWTVSESFMDGLVVKNGRVGIGTANPSLDLHVFGSAMFRANEAGLNISPGTDYGQLTFVNQSGSYVSSRLYWGKTEFMGNVGIGTSNPTNLLELSSTSPKLFFNRESSSSNLSGLYWRATADNFEGAFVRNNNTGAFELYSNANGSTPRMMITDGGNVGIGSTSPLSKLSVGGDGVTNATISSKTSQIYGYGVYGLAEGSNSVGIFGFGSGDESIGVKGYTTNNTGTGVLGLCYSQYGKAVEGYGNYSGTSYDFDATGPGVNYGSTSSKRWKSNIIEIENPLEKLFKLRGVYFDWDEEHGGGHDVGCIAEEVGAVLPEIVVFEENGIDADGMDYSKLTPLLIEAVKAQQAMIEKLQSEVELLKQNQK